MATIDMLLIAADPREFSGAMRYWRHVQPLELRVHWARSAVWKGRSVVAIANGAGPRRSALAKAAVSAPVVVNVGFCGALDPRLKIGDIVVGAEGLQPKTSPPYASGPLASVDHIAQTSCEKRALRETGAIAVEMEAAGLAGYPAYFIKSVSDLADESFANDLNAMLQPDGRMSVPKLLFHACLRPFSRIPELKRLQERSSSASNTLGEFLESCEF